jgi:hypothetical protein
MNYQHPNTPIPFKIGINIRGGKKDDFSSAPRPAASLAAPTLLFPRKNYINQLVCHPS